MSESNQKESKMNERTKLGAAVIGGYVLGRTKKGMAAARFAMWLSGSPQVVEAARGALSAPEVKAITDQVSGPLADAARQAALAAVLNRIGGLNDALVKRTEALTNTVEGTAEDVTDTATEATDKVSNADIAGKARGLIGKIGKKRSAGKDQQEEPQEQQPEGEEEDEQDEPSEDEQEPEDDEQQEPEDDEQEESEEEPEEESDLGDLTDEPPAPRKGRRQPKDSDDE